MLHLSLSQLGGKERRASGMERQGEWEGNREGEKGWERRAGREGRMAEIRGGNAETARGWTHTERERDRERHM